MKYLFTIAVALVLATGSNIALADSSAPTVEYVPSVHQIIVLAAEYYNTDPVPLLKVATCESHLNPNAIGDHGKAINIFQYHKETFIRFSQMAGLQNVNYNSDTDQAMVTAYIFKNYPQYKSAWTCSRKVGVV